MKIADAWRWVKDVFANIGLWLLLPFRSLWQRRPAERRRQQIDDAAYKKRRDSLGQDYPGIIDTFIPPSFYEPNNLARQRKYTEAHDGFGANMGPLVRAMRNIPLRGKVISMKEVAS